MSDQRKNLIRTRRPRPRTSRRHRFLLLLIIVVAPVGGIAGVLWWEERPLARAESLLEGGDPIRALEVINQFLSEHPQHGPALSLKARILVANGEPAAAIDLFERVGAAEPEGMHAWGQALLQQEQWSAALPVLEFVLSTGVDRADVLHELAACRAKLGDYDGALAAAEEFSQEPGFAARGQLLLGTIHRERGNLQQVALAWGEVLKHAPDGEDLQIPPGEFFLEYGRVLLSMGESDLAARHIERSLLIEERSDALVSLGDAETQRSRPDDAERAYRRALELNSGERGAIIGLAQLALSRGDAAASLELLAPFESTGTQSTQVAFLLQRSYTQLGNAEAAERWRERADTLRNEQQLRETVAQILRDYPETVWAHVIRAYQFAQNGNWAQAELILTPMIESAEDQPFIQSLSEAVRTHGPLPPLDELPVIQY